jgi:hypothetical protein
MTRTRTGIAMSARRRKTAPYTARRTYGVPPMSEASDSERLYAELRAKLPTVMLRGRSGSRIFCRAPDGHSVVIGAKSPGKFNYKWNLSTVYTNRRWAKRFGAIDEANGVNANYWRYYTDSVEDLVAIIVAELEAGNGTYTTRD